MITLAHPTGRCSRCGHPIQPGQLWLVRTGAHVACRGVTVANTIRTIG